MNTVTTVHLSPADFQAMLDKAVARAASVVADRSIETWGYKEMAQHYGVSVRTIAGWAKISGRLPPRIGSRWAKSAVLKWDADRLVSPISAQ